MDGLFLRAAIAPGNRGGSFFFLYLPVRLWNTPLARYCLYDALPYYDGIVFIMDVDTDEELEDSKEELNRLLSNNLISQPIVILVPTQNASGYANDPELISQFELEDVIRKGNGRVSIFAYSLSPTRFIGCLEGQLWTVTEPLELILN